MADVTAEGLQNISIDDIAMRSMIIEERLSLWFGATEIRSPRDHLLGDMLLARAAVDGRLFRFGYLVLSFSSRMGPQGGEAV